MMNHNVMRDPLRAGMEARAHGLPKLLLGVAAVLVFFALEMKNCAGMEGAAAVALIGAACMALLTFGAWRALKEQPVMVLLCAAMLAMLAVAAHLAMLDIKPGRVSKVLAPMLEEMWNYDLGTAMAWEDGAWSGGYLIVMALISRLENFSQLYAVKLVDMVCQTAAALARFEAGAHPERKAGHGGGRDVCLCARADDADERRLLGAVRRDVRRADALGTGAAAGRPSGLGLHAVGAGCGDEASGGVPVPPAACVFHEGESLHPPSARGPGGVCADAGGLPDGWTGPGGGLWPLCSADQ